MGKVDRDLAGESSPDESGSARVAIDALYEIAYDELKAIAAAMRRGDPFAAISTRTLVHEAWMRLAASPQFQYVNAAHLRNIVIRKMRQVLVDSARRRRAAKRDGIVVTVDDASLGLPEEPGERILAIDEALRRLEQLDAGQARIVEARFIGGLSFAEIAADEGVSESTIRRSWKAAKLLLEVWLADSG
jgi:RNA polymerase sigma factor (TIGR02999 family)